ncbi:hypothetical protein DWG88_01410 [Escherichia coli]|nr:hypothetical protein [Escherichia coli]EFA4952972.1 hypothetical protein [Escherichia coli]EFO1473309.1 hypothetical protein [Escherichia coli]
MARPCIGQWNKYEIVAKRWNFLSRIACNSFYLCRVIATFQPDLGKVHFVHAGCDVNALFSLQIS